MSWTEVAYGPYHPSGTIPNPRHGRREAAGLIDVPFEDDGAQAYRIRVLLRPGLMAVIRVKFARRKDAEQAAQALEKEYQTVDRLVGAKNSEIKKVIAESMAW